MKNDGGPAFPEWNTVQGKYCPGMSLRDWLIGQYGPALLLALKDGWVNQLANADIKDEAVYKAMAQQTSKIVDAMLAEREKRNDTPG